MGLLDWLRGKSAPPMPDPPHERADLDWRELEDALASAITAQMSDFSDAHSGEEFYAFALDCNAYYANVLFCLNTPESLEGSARSYANQNDNDSLAKEREALRWGLGDWRYQGFNLESRHWPEQVPMLDDFAELPHPDDTEQFLVICCRALLRAQRSGAFEALRKTVDFAVACIDHDEDFTSGEARLERVRAGS